MLITKKESKQLRYFARANYKADVKGTTAEDGSKVKHRDFPVFGLSYDEKKADKGMVEITNIQVLYKPFTGTTFEELMKTLNDVLGSDEVCEKQAETVEPSKQEQDKTLTEQAVDAVKDKSDTIVIAEKPGDIIKKTLKDCFPEGSEISVDVKPEENRIDANVFIPNSVDHIDVQIKAKPAEPETVDAAESVGFLEDHDTVLEVKPAAPQELPVVENVEEAKQVVEETGKPVITAEQVSSVHLDDAADGSHDETAVFVPKEQKPKKLTRAELYDLQMKCGVMRLATLYGEDPDTKLDVLMKLYPDAATRLNEVYAADGIKTYTITEEAIKKAYPDEYAALCELSAS